MFILQEEDKMNISEKNSLKTEIKEIVELCEKAIPEYGEKATYFRDGASEEEIAQWEKDNMLMIPEEYKDWLRVARYSVILFDLAILEMPYRNQRIINNPDLFIIGSLVGDGELVCISINTGRIIRIMDGNQREYASFGEFLRKCVIKLMRNTCSPEHERYILDVSLGPYEELNCRQIKEKTRKFNELSVIKRKEYLSLLRTISMDIYDDFVEDIRRQAVLDYWQHERDLLRLGQGTRAWNPNQIEAIMNINVDTGNCEKEAGRPRG
jgi:hypothetical protein